MTKRLFLFAVLFVLIASSVSGQKQEPYTYYLFTYFTGNGADHESIRFALSDNGYQYRALNNNMPVISSADVSITGGLRDPHILRKHDGKGFYMVATDMQVAKYGWGPNIAMVLMQSDDLVHWKSSIVNIPQSFAAFKDVNRVWAPQTIYDESVGKYMIYWSMRFGEGADVIYYSYANKDFTALETEPKQLYFNPGGGATIDGDIIKKDGLYHLFFKTEGSGKGLKIAVSKTLNGGYVLRDKFVQQTKDPVEGSGVFKLNQGKDYILMYDLYTTGKYQFTRTSDLEHFQVIDQDVDMDFRPRHGTVMPITRAEAARLSARWVDAGTVMRSLKIPGMKPGKVDVDTVKKEVLAMLDVKSTAKRLSPTFFNFPGVLVSTKATGANVFSCTVKVSGKTAEVYQVKLVSAANPVLQGAYADPDIAYFADKKRFYMYPTSDGFRNWSGSYFKAFSSEDLQNWKDEGIILDLRKDVSWARNNAWAPTITSRKIDGLTKYFFYFTAGQKIGVASSDSPAGPFRDSGKPLVEGHPAGINRGQEIDPMAFHDPQTGKYYLYWGNGYLAVTELNDDMLSLKGAPSIITPDHTFREGAYVIFRKNRYYFFWSENDTRDENYRVRYGFSDSATGKITIPEHNLVLQKDAGQGIYGTGHNSVIQVPGKDEWYMVYHRFVYPEGIKMGRDAGYNREVCINRLEFDDQGLVKEVHPDHQGIKPVKL